MMSPRGRQYTATAENLTLLADTGDIFNLQGATHAGRIVEVRVWQRGSTTLVMDTITMRRGVIGTPGGGTLTERLWDVSDTSPAFTAYSLPTDDVGTIDWEYSIGWNLLQEAVWLPTPELQLHLKLDDDFGIYTQASTAHTGVGVTVTWIEYGI